MCWEGSKVWTRGLNGAHRTIANHEDEILGDLFSPLTLWVPISHPNNHMDVKMGREE